MYGNELMACQLYILFKMLFIFLLHEVRFEAQNVCNRNNFYAFFYQ